MFIVDYSTDYQNRNIETTTFNDKSFIVTWIAEKSELNNFRLVRINKYEKGKLLPYCVSINHGRITIEADELEKLTL